MSRRDDARDRVHCHLHHRARRPAAACALLWRARSAPALPVVCLPGLARTAADFDALAAALASDAAQPRRVIALDYRGRGQSDYDRDPANYTFPGRARRRARGRHRARRRAGDFRRHLARRHSRHAARRACGRRAIAGVVLNDIGPVIEPKGLMRIKGYVGKLPQPRIFEEGAEILRRLFDAQFPKLDAGRLAGQRAAHLPARATARWCRPTTSSSPRRSKASISSTAAAAVEGVRRARATCR